MRLFLLPISTRRSLIYCQRLNNQLSSETTYVDRLTARASNTWLRWEKAEKGWRTGWQRKVTHYGNKLFETIPHEEWGLKSIPPLSKRRKDEELKGKKEVEVIFPASVIAEDKVKLALREFAGDERQALHTKWMWATIISMPLSAPAALIPVLPNIPFFYMVFRAWSHWRARSGSRHIDFLLDNRLLKFTTSSKLQLAYEAGGLDVSMKQLDHDVGEFREEDPKPISKPNAETDMERMLLTQSNGGLVSELLDVPELEEHLQRAIKQVEKALRADKELQEEKQDLDNVNKQGEPKR
ncbi:MAG: hypothetical protein LQ339_002917 [Xanthoria mediterranea]|nr:MAG: hypothetical protein LQ339_002917 [Xanthoria mediterranea]